MRFHGQPGYKHDTKQKVGVLLANLGTPQAATSKALKPYLKEFLSDPRVIDAPRLIWWFVLNCFILIRRPAASAHAYKQIWTEQGSPLLVNSLKQRDKLRDYFTNNYANNVLIELGMTYGQPSISSALKSLQAQGAESIIVLPVYPQYSAASSGSVFDVVCRELMHWRRVPGLNFIDAYYDEPLYIKAIVQSIRDYRQQHGAADLLLFSYHGLPVRYLTEGDPYFCHCQKTSRLIAQALSLEEHDYKVTFQSRFGSEPWLQPYTEQTLKALPAKGIKRVQLITPGFASDCVETLEEIDMQNRDFFLAAGGESFQYIPCLNADQSHIDVMVNLIERQLKGLLQSPRYLKDTAAIAQSKKLAESCEMQGLL